MRQNATPDGVVASVLLLIFAEEHEHRDVSFITHSPLTPKTNQLCLSGNECNMGPPHGPPKSSCASARGRR